MSGPRGPRSTAPLAAVATLALALSGVLAPRVARAQLQMEVQPAFGEGCVPRTGPTELVVGLSNPRAAAVAGQIEVQSLLGSYQPGVRTLLAVPFSLGPRAHATVRVPTPAAGVASGDAVLLARDAAGAVLTQRVLRYDNLADAFVIDATPQSRLAFTVRAALTPDPLAQTLTPSPLAALATGLTACPALRVPQTGEVVLPRSLAGYNGVRLLVVDAGSVMALAAPERTALADYVLSGGTVVLVPSRADELRHPTLAAFVGAGVTGVVPPALDTNAGPYGALSAAATAPGTFPRANTLQGLQSFEGGNLHTRTLAPLLPYGAPNLLGGSAEYGYGHVHVLSFNPTMPPALEDPWAVSVVLRLAQQSASVAHERLLADATDAGTVPPAVRRALDPNEGFRSGLGFAVALLALYAVVAGPLAFRLAARRGRPLRALALLPLFAAAAFAGIVVLGGASRGWQGRARRLSVLELPAGMPRGAVRRYRGYFSGDSGSVDVVAPGFDRRLYVEASSGTGFVTLELGRDRARLRGFAVTAWTTAVVREDAFETQQGSVTLQPDAAGHVRVVNHTNRALREVVLLAPGGAEGWTFREIPPGQSRLATQGTPLPQATLLALASGGSLAPAMNGTPVPQGMLDSAGWHPGSTFGALFAGDAGVVERWDAALGAVPRIATPTAIEPVLIAQLAGPPTVASDGGLRVDRDETVVRVTGWGGAL